MPASPIFTSIALSSSAVISSPVSDASPGSTASPCGSAGDASALAAAEPEIVAHMNRRPCRCPATLCQASARARRRGLAYDRHRPGGPGSAAPDRSRWRNRPARLCRAGADAGGGAARPGLACRAGAAAGRTPPSGAAPAVPPQSGSACRRNVPGLSCSQSQPACGARGACPASMEESLDQADKRLLARTPRFGLVEQGMPHLHPVHWNLTAPFLYEHAVRRGEGDIGSGGSFVANTGRSYRALAARQIHRQRARHQGHGRLGADQPADRAGAVRQPAPADARLSARARVVRAGPLRRRRPRIPAAGAGRQPERLAQPVRAQHVHPAAARRARGFPAGLHDPARARFPRRSRNSTASAPRLSFSSISPRASC